MLYIIVSHKANTEMSNCLISYLKKFSIGTKQENVGKESREEVCINKEVLLTSKMSQESQSLQKLG